jgi:hypothetical protein
MKLLDPLRHLFTYRTRGRYVVLMATCQDRHALVLLMVLHRGISYEVYNSMHASREPVQFDHYEPALRYMFPRSIEAAQTPENQRLRRWAQGNAEDELIFRGEIAAPFRPRAGGEEQSDEHLKTAIIALGGVGTDRAAALAMEIHRGMERRRKELP